MMTRLYHWLTRYFKRKRGVCARDIEKQLSPQALALLQGEAEFLRQAHGVVVSGLAPGEVPGKPQAIDPEVEARFATLPPPE